MPKKRNWVWILYIAFLTSLIGRKVYNLVTPTSPNYFYYFFLRTFDPIFFVPYILNYAQVIINVIHLIPLTLYIFYIPAFNRRLWQTLFIARVIFDILGHTYEIRILTSFLHDNPLTCLFLTAQSVVPYVPSYVACYRYAFSQSSQIEFIK